MFHKYRSSGAGSLKRDSNTGASREFFRTPISKNICEWLLTNLFYKNEPPVSIGKKR